MAITRRIFLKFLAVSFFFQKLFLKGLSKSDAAGQSRLKGQPMGSSNKPRVLRIYNPEATFWDYKTNPYTDFIRQESVDQMLEKGLCLFTNTNSAAQAWKTLMPSYKNGDIIAIKPNLNALHVGYKQIIDTSPTLINSVVGSLIDVLGTSPINIYVYDLCLNARIIERFIKYPVNCVGKSRMTLSDKLKLRLNLGLNTSDASAAIKMRHPIYDTDGEQVSCYIPKVLTRADHLINIPVLKAHQLMLISSAFKNHFGTVRFSNYNQYPGVLHGEPLQPALVDIYQNEHIKNKTRLIIVDGLFGAPLYEHRPYRGLPTQWQTFPQDKTPNSIFISKDPVAVESVIADYVTKEQEHHNLDLNPHDYLHLAAKEGLGTHEHRSGDGSYSLIQYEEIRV